MKFDYGDRVVKLHTDIKTPTIYFFYENGAKVWVEVDPKDVGICDEDCTLFRGCDCETKRKDGYCDRSFKPLDHQTAQELGMIG